jgi:hypothetical protein
MSTRHLLSRRSVLAGMMGVAAFTATRDMPVAGGERGFAVSDLLTDRGGAIYVADYATPQLAANAASGKRLIFPEGQTYPIPGLKIPANCYIEGNGSTLKFADNTTLSTTQSDEILAVNGSGVTIDNLNFDGNSQNQGTTWSQHRHCIRIPGPFSNVTVKECDMMNIIGDGVYINTQTGSNIKVGPNNTFSAHFDMRNGVSVVTGDTVEVFSNTFVNTARSGMPGAIDIEPNLPTDHLMRIDVHDNTIIGGPTPGTGTLPGIVYSGFRNAAATDVKIRNNNVSGTRFTCGILAIGINGGPFNAGTGLVIDSNNIHGIGDPGKIGIELDYWIGATVTNNTLNGMQYGIYNYRSCLQSSTGNTFASVTSAITDDIPQCS